MDYYFQDKVAVVTGAGGTLCSEISFALATKGLKVVLIGRTEEKLNTIYKKITENGGTAMTAVCDVTNEDDVTALASKVSIEFGPCNFLINGAGGNNIKAMTTVTQFDPAEMTENENPNLKGFFDIETSAFESVLKVNTMGTVIPTKIFAKQMAKNKAGNIINFASMNTYTPLTRVSAYAMSKAAIANFTQWSAAYFATAGIRVNAIAPGFFVNERSKHYLGTIEEGLTERGKSVIRHTPSKRFGEPKDLIGTTLWLMDNRVSDFVTGITVPVDGGFLSCTGV